MISRRDAPAFAVKLVLPGATANDPGTPIDVTERVLSFVYDEEDNMIDKLELTLDNFDLEILDDPNWKTGNGLLVAWGYAGNLCDPRYLVIQDIKGSTQIKITAYAKTIVMNKVKKSKTFKTAKRSDIVGRIAAANGYKLNEQFIEDTLIVHDHIHQANMTDAEFMKHLANKEGFVFHVSIDGLHWERRKVGAAPTRTFTWFNDPEQGDLLHWEIDSSIPNKPGEVRAAGRTPDKKKIDTKASNDNTKRDVLAPMVEITAHDTGIHTYVYLSASTTALSNAVTPESAKREADGLFIQSQQTVVKLSLSCIGDPMVSAKQVIIVNNISKRFSGRYYVSKATHTLTGESYLMRLGVKSDGGNGGPAAGPAASKGALNKKPETTPDGMYVAEGTNPQTGEHYYFYKPVTGT